MTWNLAATASDAYLRWAKERGALFALPAWAGPIERLGATALYVWHEEKNFGALLAVFKRGPCRIGVLGFPVAGASLDALSANSLNAIAKPLCKQAGLDLLRINISMQSAMSPLATAARPDAWIDDMSHWDLRTFKRLRKDLAYARRAKPTLLLRTGDPDPAGYHALYVETVRQHGGKLRYSQSYFEALAAVAEVAPGLHHYNVVDADGRLRGFSIMAVHEACAYYLHGGCDEAGRKSGASDLLMEAMQRDASSCARFNLMASPWEQPGLLAFKRKWSNHEGLALTFDIASGVAGRLGRSLMHFRGRSDRARAWQNVALEQGTHP